MPKVNYEESKIRFVNPYNFVPVDLRAKRECIDVTKKREPLLTGYLDCGLICKTPLAIPDTQNAVSEDGKHYKYPFYMAGGSVPVIPGSALRGVIRNVFEALTNSCFGTMQKDTRVTIRSAKAFTPGLLIRETDGWKLYKAKRWLLVTDKKFFDSQELAQSGILCYRREDLSFHTGQEVTFLAGRADDVYESRGRKIGPYIKKVLKEEEKGKISGDVRSGFFCQGEIAPKRHFESVFEKGRKLEIKVTEQDFERLESTLAIYRNKSINQKYQDPSETAKTNNSKENHTGYPDYENAKKKGVIPVYFDEKETEKGKLYLTMAALGRKAFQRSLNDAAGKRSHQECTKRSSLCPACALFGTVGEENLGSRVRFTDAECTNFDGNSMTENVTFAELSSPKISYTPFYLRPANGKKAEDYKEIDYKPGYDSRELEIRGRKFYWHHKPDSSSAKNIERNERNATFDVLNENAEFNFRIYFDGITDGQLAMLEEAVHLNDNEPDGDKCHKIGHGKPLGYGSVKIFIKECTLRQFDTEQGWGEAERKVSCPVKAHTCGDKTYEALMKISDFCAAEKFGEARVEYPGVIAGDGYASRKKKSEDNDLAAHRWFSWNFRLGSRNPKVILSEIKDEKGELVKVQAVSENGRPGRPGVTSGNSSFAGQAGNPADKLYTAFVLSGGRPARNSNFLEYDIRIEGDPVFVGKDCTMTAHKSIRIGVGQEVVVTLYKYRMFNYKGFK